MKFKACTTCEHESFCPLRNVVEEVQKVFEWADVVIDVDHLDDGHKMKIEPAEAYESVMIVLGSMIRQFNMRNVSLGLMDLNGMGKA
jgi:RNA polymerase subunit RPABC4/transcription elongation factor Spt4